MPNLIHRILRALVRLLPVDFRSDFGRSMGADLTERGRVGDRRALLTRELPSLLVAVVREHAGAVLQDVRYAWRTMRRTPGFTAMAVLMLALGTGVNVAMFSIIDAVLLRSPFRNPDQIVSILDIEGRRTPAQMTATKYRDLVTAPGPFAAVAAFTGGGSHVTTASGTLRRLDVECVSASMFDVLGAPPLLGRRFDATEDRPDAPPVMVLSYPFWRRLGGSPSILGSTLVVNQTPVAVIGVMPRFFAGPLSRSDTEAWLPMNRPVSGGGSAGCPPATASRNVFGRLADDVTREQTAVRLSGFQLEPISDAGLLEGLSQQFLLLGAVVLSVLLIACFNVGGLQMERTLARRQELAVRLALGASRGRLVRQIVTENLVLAVAGAVAGVMATWFTLRAIVLLLPTNVPHADEIDINARVLAVALLAASAAGVIAGLLPIGQTRRLDLVEDLASSSRSGNRQGSWARRALVIVEVALSVVVLIGAALTIQTFLTLRPTQPGFDPTHKLSTRVSLAGDTPATRRQFVADLFDRLRLVPGVRRATASTYLPFWGSSREVPVRFADTTEGINTGYITPEFFDVMKIPILAGRAFTTQDTAASVPVAIVDEVFARRIRPDGRVLGERITPTLGVSNPPVERQIVGIVAATRSWGTTTAERSIAWMPYTQEPINFVIVVAESDGRPEAALAAELRGAIQALRPNVVPTDPEPMTAMLYRSVSWSRFAAWMLGVFAVLAVLLAAIGLMTTIGWWVRQRRRELGVRLALGATRSEIVRLVCVQGLILAGTGIAVGCVAAAGATRYLQGWLFGITPLDIPTFAFGAAAMIAVAAIAVFVPVRQATSVDPAIALRE